MMCIKRYVCSFFFCLLLVGAVSSHAFAYSCYITEEGQTIAGLAEKFSLSASTFALINDVEEHQPLKEGTVLRMPEIPCFALTVKAGDTLSSLSRSYGVSLAELAMQNGLRNNDRIYAGQQLLIPLGEDRSVCAAAAEEDACRAVYASRSGIRYLWPTAGTVSSLYGKRWGDFHWGLDIAADSGSPIIAAAAGWVMEAGWKNDAYGYTVMLDHGNGIQTLYAHASALAAKEGQRVEAGQLIAYVGSTGNSTGPHVHFEIRLDGVCVDPLQYLER